MPISMFLIWKSYPMYYFFVCSSLRSFTSWLRTSSSPTWAWRCSLSRITSSTPSSSSGLSYPFWSKLQTNMHVLEPSRGILFPHSTSSNSCRIRSLWRICAFVTSKKQLQKNNQIIKSPLFRSGLDLWSDLLCWRLPELPPVRLPYLLVELWMSIRCPSSSTWAGGTRSRATSSTWWCLLVWPNIFATPIQSPFF